MLPQRQIIANVCQWKYRSAECGYTGSSYWNVNDQPVGTLAADVCGKRVESCKLRFGAATQLPFGSYPGAGLVQ
jgi:lambda family phage minor tail protein L